MSWTKWRVGTACAYAGYVLVALGNAVSPQGVDRVDLHRVRAAAKRAALPARLATRLCAQGREFLQELDAVLTTEGYLLRLVDKKHPLPETFVPKHLVPVREQWLFFSKGRSLLLTKIAYEALHQLIQAAARDGVALSVGSAYRSFAYQKKLFSWYAQEHGMQEAMRFSAREGTSQHQLGTVVDFGSITPAFARSDAGRWTQRNAHRFGWSLSFPPGYEQVTGYVWEPWHFRYVGVRACALQKKWFEDIQQYMLGFIHEWKVNASS
ncbi:M15 family metallopeptidase [Treponema pallidum]|uniref:M15 family metallopeptidase n=1 Tax=Treponema pallidum TaxID=160 RepID=UPI00024DCCB4|nr:D-alanyl-D-alanine carboxypeptidase family protein [Treponema pallidum]AEZ60545.1 serine-type D-Ala-D-Ala carboxypeptidase [Treponema pallidum subsp. pallidum DAL-1]AFU66245.1 serine-type D-Ala-D-Ala carboxypeptidase [Treponema pallidum subsp. pallidum str. Mexico A]AGN75435.1 serine-type D-Ala-D-Ala carboxypeptidase [Treponema pallidum subsp. pallidum str. Nichols]AGN76410.1 serine-type D-Ala-D-Ala carboxypeptidase [Treponema pallidum subsp. pallidum SS14]AHN66921.1 serine-type D-Ala-D-Ala